MSLLNLSFHRSHEHQNDFLAEEKAPAMANTLRIVERIGIIFKRDCTK